MKKRLLFIFFILAILCPQNVVAYQYKGKNYEYKLEFYSYKVLDNTKVYEIDKDGSLIFYISDKGYATIIWGRHEQSLSFAKNECYIQQSALHTLLTETNDSRYAHVGNTRKFIKIIENGYAEFHYTENGKEIIVSPIDIINMNNDGASVYTRIFYKSFMQVEGKSESMAAQTKSIKPYKSIPVNKKNLKAKFSISGTIRNMTPIKSPFGGLSQAAKKWGQVYTGAFNANNFGILTYEGNGFQTTSETPMLIKRAADICNSKNIMIADVCFTDENRYVFLMDCPHPETGSKDAFIARHIPDEMRQMLETMQKEKDIVFFAASLNDKGNWCITSNLGYVADDETNLIIDKAKNLYGKVACVYMTNLSTIVCCEKGIYCKDIPSNVYNKLLQINFKPLVIKYSDLGLYLITEGDRKYVTNL